MTSTAFEKRVRGYDVVEQGHRVRRLLPSPELPMVGPFVLFDHFGPATLAPGEGVDIAPHLHAHLATVTYFFEGATHHTDDLGHDVIVERGDVAWMHAGAGIVHAERTPDVFRATGGVGHGVQMWTALPEAVERSAPRFQRVRAANVPHVVVDGVSVRVLVGEAFGARSPVEASSHVRLMEARTTTSAGEIALPPSSGRHALYVVEGIVAIDGTRIGVGTLLLLREGHTPRVKLEPQTTMLVFGGDPLGRRYLQGNVIGSSEDRLEQALSSPVAVSASRARGAERAPRHA
ncbi:MAG: pirin family protein [Deltaproteobacteria bacterium]|nr:pirin family protein [Deltaproteobacteria bacterium]